MSERIPVISPNLNVSDATVKPHKDNRLITTGVHVGRGGIVTHIPLKRRAKLRKEQGK